MTQATNTEGIEFAFACRLVRDQRAAGTYLLRAELVDLVRARFIHMRTGTVARSCVDMAVEWVKYADKKGL